MQPAALRLKDRARKSAHQLLLLAVVFSTSLVLAQNNLATITGAVTDSSAALIPGTAIEATNVATGVTYRSITTDAGIYTIPLIPAGTYSIRAIKEGFSGTTRNGIEIRTGDRIQVDLSLEVGSSAQNISVSAEAPLLETATASRGTVLSTRQVSDLPVNARNVTLLATLAPGVQTVNDQASTQNRPFDGGFTDRIAINGGRTARNNYLLNGISNFGQDQSTGYANVNFQPSPDAVQEVRVQTNDYSAEFGHTSGGTINVNLKSGTNQLHGSAYYFLQNTLLRANTFTNNATGKPISAFQWNEPGLEVDGPVIIPHLYNGRNRTFWMFAWERIKDKIPTPGNFRVPTLLERSGDFSQTRVNGVPITIYDPITRVPFNNNAIPIGQQNPVALAMLKYFPLPNITTNASGTNFYPGDNAQTDTYDTFTSQVDQVINERNRLTMTFARNARSQRQADNGIAEVASTDYFHHRDNTVAGLAWTDVLNPTTVLNIRTGFSRHLFQIEPTAAEFGAAGLTSLGFPASLVAQLPLQAFPSIGFCADTSCSSLAGNGNYLTIGGATNFQGGLVKNFSNNIAVAGMLSKNVGRHSLKFGAEFDDTLNNRITAAVMALGFSPVFTQQNPLVNVATQGNAFADFLLGYPGLPNGASVIGGNTPITPGVANNISPALANRYYAAFFQDDWRINSRLTVNLGLRWDLETPPTERYNRQNAGFDRATAFTRAGINLTGGLLFASGNNRTPFPYDLNNFQPRIGAAYKLTDKTVIRGGYASMYLPSYGDSAYFNGFSNITQYVQSNDGNQTPANSLSNPFPSGLLQPSGSSNGLATLIGTGGMNFSVSDRPIPNVKQFTIGIQQQLPAGFVLDLAYAGSRTRQLEVSANTNYLSSADLARGAAFLNSSVANPYAVAAPAGTPGAAKNTTQQQLLLPFPQFFGTVIANNIPIGYSWYNALQLRLERRLARGLFFGGSFTYSKNMEAVSFLNPQDPSPDHSLNPQNYSSNTLARVVTADDAPYRIRLTGVYQLPSVRGGGRVVRALVGGWQTNAIVTIQAGTPISAPANAFSTGVDQSVSNPSGAHYFNTCYLDTAGNRRNCAIDAQPAWIQQPSFTLAALTPRMSNVRLSKPTMVDFSIFKTFALYESLRLQFRAESFNLTNTPFFGAPNTSLTSAAFGQVSNAQTNDPRVEQLSLRIEF